jgi:hypothetical protein
MVAIVWYHWQWMPISQLVSIGHYWGMSRMASKHCLKIPALLPLEFKVPSSNFGFCSDGVFILLCCWFAVAHTMVLMVNLAINMNDRKGLLLLLLIV